MVSLLVFPSSGRRCYGDEQCHFSPFNSITSRVEMNTNTRHDNTDVSPLSTITAQRVKYIHNIPNTISMSNSICRDKMDTCTAIQHQGMICSRSNYHERVSCKHHYITQIVVKTTTHLHIEWMRPHQTKDKDNTICFIQYYRPRGGKFMLHYVLTNMFIHQINKRVHRSISIPRHQ